MAGRALLGPMPRASLAIALALLATACSSPRDIIVPPSLELTPVPVLPVRLTVRWAERDADPTRPTPQPLPYDQSMAASVFSVRVLRSKPRERLDLALTLANDPGVLIELSLPLPPSPVDLATGDELQLTLARPADPATVVPAALSLSLVRPRDGLAIHILHGRGFLPQPFPEDLRVEPQRRPIARAAWSGRDLCEREIDRLPFAIARAVGEDLPLWPGQTKEITLLDGRRAELQARDCTRLTKACHGEIPRRLNCQVVVTIRGADLAP